MSFLIDFAERLSWVSWVSWMSMSGVMVLREEFKLQFVKIDGVFMQNPDFVMMLWGDFS